MDTEWATLIIPDEPSSSTPRPHTSEDDECQRLRDRVSLLESSLIQVLRAHEQSLTTSDPGPPDWTAEYLMLDHMHEMDNVVHSPNDAAVLNLVRRIWRIGKRLEDSIEQELVFGQPVFLDTAVREFEGCLTFLQTYYQATEERARERLAEAEQLSSGMTEWKDFEF